MRLRFIKEGKTVRSYNDFGHRVFPHELDQISELAGYIPDNRIANLLDSNQFIDCHKNSRYFMEELR